MTNRHDIITCARQFMGVRFVHQGRSRAGLDCLGLLLAVAAEAGLIFEDAPVTALDVPTYGMRPDTALLRAKLAHYLTPIPREEAGLADIVLLTIDSAPQHLGILSDYPMAGELGMIHAYAPARKVVEHRYDQHWRRATCAAYRIPHLTAE